MISKSTLIGQYIADITQTYTFIRELGKGSYGVVYRVQNKLTGEYRACKKLNKRKLSDVARFKVEIDLLKATDHPNIVKLLEIYEDTVFIYLIMEECLGGEFFDRLAERARSSNLYTEREAARIFRELMEAINYCHSHGVCHRDIKPENILFSDKSENSTLKICDFGLSKVFSNFNKIMNSVVGTIYYMAPEVIKGVYDEKCDVWSAGVILYIMLCAHPPFYGRNDQEVMKKINNKSFHFEYKEWKVISDQAKELISKILVDSHLRPSSEDVLNHPWVQELAPHSNEEVINLDWMKIKTYSNLNKLQKSVISFAAFRLRDEDTKELKEIFKCIDINNDGVLTALEIQKGFEILRKKYEEQVLRKKLKSSKQNSINSNKENYETCETVTNKTEGFSYKDSDTIICDDILDGREITFSGYSTENLNSNEMNGNYKYSYSDVLNDGKETDITDMENKVDYTKNISNINNELNENTKNENDINPNSILDTNFMPSENFLMECFMTCEDINSVFNEIDLDKNGLINYNEFISATVDYKHKIKKDHIFEAFKSFDKDKSGKISFKELLDVIKPQTGNDLVYLKNLFLNFDKNQDGEVDWEEFLAGLELQ